MERDELITRVVQMLEEDATRLGVLPWDVVLRVCERNGLSSDELVAVRDRLLAREVSLDEATPGQGGTQGQPAPERDGKEEVLTERLESDDRETRDLLAIYMREAREFETLDAAEERALMRRVRAGEEAAEALEAGSANAPDLRALVDDGTQARKDFLNANLKLVIWLARRAYRSYGVDLNELVQEGNLGLLRAVEKFDHERGLKFATYALYWIRATMERAIADKSRLVRLPVHLHDRLRKFRRARRALERELRRAPTVWELADYLGWRPELVQFTQDLQELQSKKPVSLDRPVDDQGTTLGEMVAAAPDDRPDAELDRKEEAMLAHHAVAKLPDRLRRIIEQRFGLDGNDERTLQEIGDENDVSRERIRQLESVALDELRRSLGAPVRRKKAPRPKGDDE